MQTTKQELPKDLFEKVPKEERSSGHIKRESVSYWQDAWRRLRSNKLAMFGLFSVILLTLIGYLGPLFLQADPNSQSLLQTNQPPSSEYIFGTDQFGRDLFTRLIYGINISMTVAYVSTAISLVIGVIYGAVSGIAGGRVDNIMMRIVDVLLGIPNLLYLILLIVVLGQGMWSIIIAFSMTGWLSMARMVRAEVLSLKKREFILASKALGMNMRVIVTRHLIPNTFGTIIIISTLNIPSAIFTEAFLSYIGLGVAVPQASLGVLASDATAVFMTYPHQLVFPALAICLLILVFNFLGDGLRDALDPKMRK